ncbi:MAG: cupredoxin domain-containing protein [Actinomycetota bacterium]
MNDKDLRERLILPVLIPVGALAFIGFLAVSIAQILLNVPHSVATAIAMGIAFNMLVAFSVVALKPDLGRFLTTVMAGVAVVPLLLGAAAASGAVSFPDAHGEQEELQRIEIAADSLVFDKASLEVAADTEFEIHFNNQEAQPHNVAILAAAGSADVKYRGTIITGPKTIDYRVPPLAAGSYHFQCDVHLNMAGTLTAA